MRRREFVAGLSGAAVCSGIAGAQPPSTPLIGFVRASSSTDTDRLVAAFKSGLQETGFLDGRDVIIEYRWADGKFDELTRLFSDLINRGVTVLLASGSSAAVVATGATATIPIVFTSGGDPVELGLTPKLEPSQPKCHGHHSTEPHCHSKAA
jgi:putative ABC transport system substrate-binding protein